jgi:isocitrate/isopropylmalate dehydrogenase
MNLCRADRTMGGDGIGPEVVEAGVRVLKVCAERDGGFTLDFQDFDWVRTITAKMAS